MNTVKTVEPTRAPMRWTRNLLAPVAVGLAALAVYVQTLLPGVGWGDIARFQYVARIWGIPHRFGYPLYIAISRLFGYLPIDGPPGTLGENYAYRANLMSAFFAALAAVMVYLIIIRLAEDWLAAVSAGLSFAFSRALWGQAVVAEVYTLNAFLIGAVILILLAWHQTRKVGLLYLGIGLYALSFGNHMTVVTLVPAVVYLILVTDYRLLLRPRHLAAMAGLALLGASQYLYVIIRAHQQPLLNELGPFSWRGWIHWMTRNRFPGQFFGFSLSDQVDRLRIYLELLEKQFFRWGYILGWIGAWERLKMDLKSTIFLVLAALGIYAFGMNYGGVTFRIYLIPSYLVFAVFLGCGLSALRRWLQDLVQRQPRHFASLSSLALATIILAMPLYPLWQNWAEVDEHDNAYYQDMAWHFVERAGPDFVLVDSEPRYDDLEAILYVAWAEKEWYAARWIMPGEIDRWLGTRPVYAWQDGAPYHSTYIEEPVPELAGMVRIIGVRTEQ
ncbi:MAG: glycosyltransferase family 117 protein [Anaerolineae bacterium]